MPHPPGQTSAKVHQFGIAVADVDYVLRPGGYAVIVRPPNQIAVLITPRGGFLPGGGQEPGETPALAAVRETREECGLSIRLLREIGVADELVYAADEATHFRKRCTFFLAEASEAPIGESESDCLLRWLSPAEADETLRHESQRWAVREVCGNK